MALTRTNQKKYSNLWNSSFVRAEATRQGFALFFLSPCALNYQGLRKAESSLAIQLHTEKMGLAAFHAHRVPDSVSLTCRCGWRQEDPKHVFIFYSSRPLYRRELHEAAETDRYQKNFVNWTGHGVVAGWAMNKGLLAHFRLQRSR